MTGRAGAIGLSTAAAALVLVGAQGPVRALAVLDRALVAPGLAWAGHLPGRAAPETAALVGIIPLGAALGPSAMEHA